MIKSVSFHAVVDTKMFKDSSFTVLVRNSVHSKFCATYTRVYLCHTSLNQHSVVTT